MRSFRLDLELTPGDPEDERTAADMLELVTRRNLRWLRRFPTTTPLYAPSNRIRYKPDPKRTDIIAAIPAVIQTGVSDCAGLACWRCAEVRRAGDADARVILLRRVYPGEVEYHAVVRLADGRIDDPSAVLFGLGRGSLIPRTR